MNIRLDPQLALQRCPHCHIDSPTLICVWNTNTHDYRGKNARLWKIYKCNGCGGLVTAAAASIDAGLNMKEIYPTADMLDESIPSKAKNFLQQALDSMHAPDGAVMLAASAIDAMLKAKSYTEGSLYSRIKTAAENHLITDDMSKWAHQVRLEANDQRHSDVEAASATTEEARKVVNFAKAFAEFLFVLPSRVTTGIVETQSQDGETQGS